jgi:hypothetical protein
MIYTLVEGEGANQKVPFGTSGTSSESARRRKWKAARRRFRAVAQAQIAVPEAQPVRAVQPPRIVPAVPTVLFRTS